MKAKKGEVLFMAKNKEVCIAILILLIFNFMNLVLVKAISIDEESSEKVELMYIYLVSKASYLDISSNTATIRATLKAKSNVDKVLITSRLQKKVNGEWKTIEAWTVSKNGYSCSLEKTKSVSKGYEYRVFSTMKSYKGDKSESVASFSEVVKY